MHENLPYGRRVSGDRIDGSTPNDDSTPNEYRYFYEIPYLPLTADQRQLLIEGLADLGSLELASAVQDFKGEEFSSTLIGSFIERCGTMPEFCHKPEFLELIDAYAAVTGEIIVLPVGETIPIQTDAEADFPPAEAA